MMTEPHVAGAQLPQPGGFPGQQLTNILGTVLGLTVGGIVGGGVGWALGGASYGGLLGMAAVYMLWRDVRSRVEAWAARRHFRNCSEKDPDDLDAYLQAALWTVASDGPRARDLLREVLRRAPGHRDATIALGHSLSAARHFEEAVTVLRTFLSENTDLMGEVIIAESLKALGRDDDAAPHFRRILEIHPGSPRKAEIQAWLATRSLLAPSGPSSVSVAEGVDGTSDAQQDAPASLAVLSGSAGVDILIKQPGRVLDLLGAAPCGPKALDLLLHAAKTEQRQPLLDGIRSALIVPQRRGLVQSAVEHGQRSALRTSTIASVVLAFMSIPSARLVGRLCAGLVDKKPKGLDMFGIFTALGSVIVLAVVWAGFFLAMDSRRLGQASGVALGTNSVRRVAIAVTVLFLFLVVSVGMWFYIRASSAGVP